MAAAIPRKHLHVNRYVDHVMYGGLAEWKAATTRFDPAYPVIKSTAWDFTVPQYVQQNVQQKMEAGNGQ